MLQLCLSMEKTKKKENVTEELHPEEDTITEYQTGYPVALHLLLPVAGLIFVLFHQKTLLNKILLQIDRNCVSVFCPSFSRRERLLKWACNRLPLTWSSQSKTLSGGISDLWHDGSLLCTLINTAIPGACPNPHRHWKKPPTHAQAIAYKYFGLVPMFTDDELSNDLTFNLERNFLHYINELQQAINKLSEKSSNINSISEKYVPRGMGLFSGEQHRKVTFYVYQDDSIKTENDSTVIVQIRGPYGTYGQAVIPRFHDGLFKVPDIKIMTDFASTTKFKSKTHFMKSFAISFMRYHKKHMGDNIVIDITMEEDRAKVTYIPKNYGMYEIHMIANGELLKGSPFSVHILKNTSGIEESFEIEEAVSGISTYKKRKVLSKTIDFVEGKATMNNVKEKSIEKEEEKTNKKSPKKTGLQFADAVSEIGKNGEMVQRNIEQKSHKYCEKQTELTKENLEEIDEEEHRIIKETILPVISTIEEEAEENESITQTVGIEKEVRHKSEQEMVNLESTMSETSEIETSKNDNSNNNYIKNIMLENRLPKIPKMALEIQNSAKNSQISLIGSMKEEKMINDYNILSVLDSEKNLINENFIDDVDSFLNKQKTSNDSKNTQVADRDIHAETEMVEMKPNNSNLNETFRRYSPPNIKLEEYTARAKINKLKIPDKFIADSDLFTKDLKNLINSSSRTKSNIFMKTKELIPINKTISSTEKINAKPIQNDNNNNTFSVVNKKVHDDIKKKETPAKIDKLESNAPESKECTSNGNVKKLLQNYQKKPSESINIVKENSIRNLHGKIKQLPHDVDIKHELCSQISQKPTINQKVPLRSIKTLNKKIIHDTVLKENTSSNNLTKNISQSNPSNLNTSPICSDHIVPEVYYRQMSVAEKREIFAQSTIEGRTTSSYSSSENENDERNVNTSKNIGHFQFEGLSVMNVLGSLKKSENSDRTNFFQNNTTSLPNIADLPDEYVFPQVVKEKKNFWEEVSSRSSSSLSTTHSIKNKSPVKSSALERSIWKTSERDINGQSPTVGLPNTHRSNEDLTLELSYDFSSFNNSTEDESMNYSLPNMSLDSNYPISMSVKERKFFWEQVYPRSASSLGEEPSNTHKSKHIDQKMRAIWSKPEESVKSDLVDKTGGIYKSENNILSLESTHYHSLKKYKSVDDSLDDCTILSIADRKKLLLRSDCFKEVSEQPRKESKPIKKTQAKELKIHNSHKKNAKMDDSEIAKKLEKNIDINDRTENFGKTIKDPVHNSSKNASSTKKPSSHSHFRKAVKYFKNLEAKSHGKPLPEKSKKLTDVKRLSLEINRYRNRKMGGSLNLPSLSTKFALSNIYDDVFGRGRGSFRGVPNRSALVEALATFSRRDEIQYYKDDAEDDIRFDLFKKRMKSKKRKSLKSVFDVCY